MSTNCNGCSTEIEDDEVQKCEHCGEDGLGNCCIGEADHPCLENQRRHLDLIGKPYSAGLHPRGKP